VAEKPSNFCLHCHYFH